LLKHKFVNAHSILFIKSTTNEEPNEVFVCRIVDTKIHFILIHLEFETIHAQSSD